jgi:hypothetical protein
MGSFKALDAWNTTYAWNPSTHVKLLPEYTNLVLEHLSDY